MALPQVPLFQVPVGKFRAQSRGFNGLSRLAKDTKSYVFEPLVDDYEQECQRKLIELEDQQIHKDIEELYAVAFEMRKEERQQMINRGYMDDETKKRTLETAIAFRGTCQDMCPTFERIKRTRQNNVNVREKDPQRDVIVRSRAMKSFARPAAGQEPPLPSDVRPPSVLVKTLNYIIDNLLDEMPETQSLIWDRTRSIRQDFTFQNYFGPETIECNEKIARIHIMSLHIMAGSTVEYSQQQELEQLEKSLKTLTEMYDEYRRKKFAVPPNEAEFRAYHLLLKINDPDLERSAENLPSEIYESKYIQQALFFRRSYQSKKQHMGMNFYTTFLSQVFDPAVPFLCACLLEVHFNQVRVSSLQAIIFANHKKTTKLTLAHLSRVLCFESTDELKKFLKFYNTRWKLDETKNECLDMESALSGLTSQPTNSNGAPIFLKSVHDTRLDNKVSTLTRSQIVNGNYGNNYSISRDHVSITVFGANASTASTKEATKRYEMQQRANKEAERQFQESLKKQEEERKIQEKKTELQNRLKQKEAQLRLEKERKQQEEEQRLKEAAEAAERQRLMEEQARQRAEAEKRMREEEEIRKRKQLEFEQQRQIELQKKRELDAKKRKKALKVSMEIFEGLVKQLISVSIFEGMSQKFRSIKVRRRALHKIVKIAKKCKEKRDKKQRIFDEFERTERDFGVNVQSGYLPKRYAIIQDFMDNSQLEKSKKDNKDLIMAKYNKTITSHPNDSLAILPDTSNYSILPYVHNEPILKETPKKSETRQTIYDEFLSKLGVFGKQEVQMLISSGDGARNIDTWVNDHFELENGRRTVNRGEVVLKVDKFNRNLVKKCAFLVFTCGDFSAKANFSSERRRLEKTLKQLDGSCYKYQIFIVYWENKEMQKYADIQIYNLLNLDSIKQKYKSHLIDVNFLRVPSEDTDGKFVKKMMRMARHFTGKLVVEKVTKEIEFKDPNVSVRKLDESSIISEHPYFRKMRYSNQRNDSMNSFSIRQSRKRPNESFLDTSFKKPKTNGSIYGNGNGNGSGNGNALKTNGKSVLDVSLDNSFNTTLDLPLAHNSTFLSNSFTAKRARSNTGGFSLLKNRYESLHKIASLSDRGSRNVSNISQIFNVSNVSHVSNVSVVANNTRSELNDLKSLISGVKRKYGK